MRTHLFAASLLTTATLLTAPAQTPAQTPAPPATHPAPAAAGLVRADANAPGNAGRLALSNYLNAIAAKDNADRRTVVAAINTKAAALARQAKVRKLILSLIGSFPAKTPLNAQVTGTTQADGFRIEKILFDSQPGFHVTALLYIPDGKAGTKLPAILMAPGHAPTGKAGDYALAATFARNGFAVLSYDPIGQGERLQYPDPAHPGQSLASRPTGEHGEAGLQPVLIGEAVAKYFVWDAMRAIDYLLTRPEIDPTRIGAEGCSGGGTITALTTALDPRIAVAGVACFTTSFDALLPTVGPQDGEQSIPGFIAGGPPGKDSTPLDFPDWIELAAPRPYGVLATYSDMFPFAGARTTVIEARRFYALFDPTNAGTPPDSGAGTVPPTPTGPALNPDTTNTIPLTAPLQFITGPGGHGALGPITGNIVSFFMRNLQPGADTTHPIVPPPRAPGAPAAPSNGLPKDAMQVTPTGQVATSYPNSETVFSLNLKHATQIIPAKRPALTPAKLATAIRDTTYASTHPGDSKPLVLNAIGNTPTGIHAEHIILGSEPGIDLNGNLAISKLPGRHPAILLLVPEAIDSNKAIAKEYKAKFDELASTGNVVLSITPRPSPPGTEETKSPILGDFYLTSLRALLVNKTLIGMRVDDTIRAIDYLITLPNVDPTNITAVASGHMGLVLLHTAVLDPRLKHITIDHTLASYDSLLKAPITLNAPEDILPGVLLRYDIPDLTKALGPRLTFNDPLQGTEDLAYASSKK
jgi:cephalosporin-C deacetylase-like acetyl esterase